MLVALVPVFCAVLGVLMYALAANPKTQELGKILYAASVFALMFTLAGRLVHLL
jgi:hypothetical protein